MKLKVTNGARSSKRAARKADAIRVMLVDRHPIVRLGVNVFLWPTPNVQVVAEAGTCLEALAKGAQCCPNVILMDVDMPDGDGLELTKRLGKELPRARVLIFSPPRPAEQVGHILQSGARGFITKNSQTGEVVQAIECVHSGETYFSADVAKATLSLFMGHAAPSEVLLSPREREVLTHITEGLGSKQIAGALNLSTRTVETHRERIMKKVGIHNVAGLTRFAIAKGYAPLPVRQPLPLGPVGRSSRVETFPPLLKTQSGTRRCGKTV